jgi:hypothetical protein
MATLAVGGAMHDVPNVDYRTDDQLTADELAARRAREAGHRAAALRDHAIRVDLWRAVDAFAREQGGVLEVALRHHLPVTVPVAGRLPSYRDWPCPGCDGDPEDSGYFPCSTIHVVQMERGLPVDLRLWP